MKTNYGCLKESNATHLYKFIDSRDVAILKSQGRRTVFLVSVLQSSGRKTNALYWGKWVVTQLMKRRDGKMGKAYFCNVFFLFVFLSMHLIGCICKRAVTTEEVEQTNAAPRPTCLIWNYRLCNIQDQELDQRLLRPRWDKEKKCGHNTLVKQQYQNLTRNIFNISNIHHEELRQFCDCRGNSFCMSYILATILVFYFIFLRFCSSGPLSSWRKPLHVISAKN